MMEISKIKIGNRVRKNAGDVSRLAGSMNDIGLLHPIVVTGDGELVSGHRRIEAAKSLGWTKIPATVAKSLDDALMLLTAERDENTCRLNFLPSEAVAMGLRLEPMETKAAKERQAIGLKKGKSRGGKLPERQQADSRDSIGRSVGLSGKTYERAKEIVESGDEALIAEMNRTKRVNGVFKKLKTAQEAEKIEAEPMPKPDGKFRVLVIDPPWQYGARASDSTHRTANPYPSMSMENLRSMEVADHAEANSILWLWTTNAFMLEAYELAAHWGFRVKTILTWAKDRMGTGDWLRGKTEHCLMAIRGKPTIRLTSQTTLLSSPAGKHSQKPDAFYEMVEQLCPGSKCEFFARSKRKGWSQHGSTIV